jgi:hypothetical protein
MGKCVSRLENFVGTGQKRAESLEICELLSISSPLISARCASDITLRLVAQRLRP